MVGKFCPLHRGHESVIEKALSQCDEVVVISYTKPEFDGCGPLVRQAWITALFPAVICLSIDDGLLRQRCRAQGIARIPEVPHNAAPEFEHREFVAWLCLGVLHRTVDAVFTSETYGDGFAQVLTQYFRARDAASAVVRHICVDQARQAFSISGTLLRSNPHRFRQYLSPAVYAAFVRRVCFLGGESSGKTSLTQALAARLQTNWVPEYGRELWEAKSGELEYEDMLQIGIRQREREAQLAREANVYLPCDTSPLTTLFYSREMFGKADPELERLAEQSYDHVFVCAPDFPFVQDGTRRDEAFRNAQHEWYLRELALRAVTFTVVSGSIERRLETVLHCLGQTAAHS